MDQGDVRWIVVVVSLVIFVRATIGLGEHRDWFVYWFPKWFKR